jgi:CubicO group peptidase (beta-lactamase class C family)
MATNDFDSVLAPHFRADGPGAAVAVRRGGQTIHVGGYGLANVEWGAPIDADTVFRIGSITKQFTAAAILKLAEDGALTIDDPIERHLADYPVGERRITIRHLLNHTSGIKSITSLPNFRSELANRDEPLSGVIAAFKDVTPDFEPGERFLYNNSGYVLLGAIIEHISGKDYATFLQESFFGPLGMASTRYLHERPVTPRRAAGYAREGHTIFNAAPLSMTWPYAAGALGSTVNDLLRWDEALRGGAVVSPESYAAMTTPNRLNDGSPANYGFGLRMARYRDRPLVGHAGGINGFMTNLVHWPDEDLTVLVLSNLVPFPVDQVTYGLARRALGLADTARTPVTLESAQLEACAGLYRFDIGPLRLAVDADALKGDWPRPGSRFRPIAEDTFFLEKDPEVTLRFEDVGERVYQRLVIEGYGEPVSAGRSAEPSDTALVGS